MTHKLIIIGSGPAGLTAAIYAGRAELSPLLFEGDNPGGPLTTTTAVENYPGFPEGVQGPELMALMRKQAERFGTKFVSKNITDVDFSAAPFKIFSDGEAYEAEAVIIATGTRANTLGLASEVKFAGRGVSYCATCDGPLFKNKKVAVVGGGDSALEEALFLSKFAAEITVIQNLADLTASKIMQQHARENPKMKFIFNSTVQEFLGEKKLEKIKIKNNATGAESEIVADGAFIAIGRTPNTKIFEGKLKMERGYIVTAPDKTATNVSGVFSAGDVSDWAYRQAVVAAGRGAMAAIEAEKYLAEK